MKTNTKMTLQAFRGFLENCGITKDMPMKEWYGRIPIGLQNITVILPDGTTEEGDFMGKKGFAQIW